MPDTGERTATSNAGFDSEGQKAHDGNDSTSASIIQFNTAISGPAIVSDYGGDDLPIGSTVNGVELVIRASFATAFAATKLLNVKLSKDGSGGTFNDPSTGVISQNLTSTAADYTFGGSSETWQHTWTDFTDISNLAVSMESDQQSDSATTAVTGIFAVGLIVHYTDAPPLITHKLELKGGSLVFKSGTIII